MLVLILWFLIVASWIYWIVAWWMVRDFFRTQPKFAPLHLPPVSILKPCRGLDVEAYENFVSFCRQDYPEFELLFGVSNASDPVVAVVHRLQRDFPQLRIRLFVAPTIGANLKVSILHCLAAQAQYDTLVISDSDIRVKPDYLRRVVAPLCDPSTGLVTCTYRGELPITFTARLEALHMGVTFLPSVIVARGFLNMRFALGATVALRRSDLARLGGFAALADYLADDYQLGARMAALGLRNRLSDVIVVIVLGATTFQEQWQREVRWARTNRVCRPWEYPGLVLTFSTPLSLVLLLVSGFAPASWWALTGSLLVRWVVAWLVTGETENESLRRWLIWLPLRDLLSAFVWCVGAVGKQVHWRGKTYLLQSDGRMVPAPQEAEAWSK